MTTQRRSIVALSGSWLSALLACLAVLVPKCPLCAAAYLCLFGVSASSARAVVELGLPLCLALIAGSTLATALFVAQRSRRHAWQRTRRRTCCAATTPSTRGERGHRVHAFTRHL